MAVILKDLKKTEVSADLKGKYVHIFGEAKTGKTTLASQFPKALILGFERGFNALDNIYATDVPNWVEFKKIVKQLKDPEVLNMFDTIVIDTYALAAKRAEAFICSREGVDKLGDIPFGAGYGMVEDEISNTLSQITHIEDGHYGIVAISHAKTTTIDDGTMKVVTIQPDLDKRAAKIINRMVDATLCLYNDDGTRMLYPRDYTISKGPIQIEIKAGNRLAGLNDPIELSYEALVEAMGGALTDGKKKVSKKKVAAVAEEVTYDFEALKAEIGTIVKELATLDKETGSNHMAAYKKIVNNNLGEGKLIKECVESQAPILDLVLDELKSYKASIQ